MSTAPRPQMNPSTISAPNGSRLHPSGFTGTTSVCPIRSSDGACGSVPSMRASFTHWLRMRSRRRSTASAVGSSALVATIYLLCAVASSGSAATVGKAADASTLGRSGSGSDRVDEAAVLAVAFRASLEHEVLEVGERLALGHHAPVLLRE